VFDDSFDDSVLDLSVVQIDANLVADTEMLVVWLLGWHAPNIPFDGLAVQTSPAIEENCIFGGYQKGENSIR